MKKKSTAEEAEGKPAAGRSRRVTKGFSSTEVGVKGIVMVDAGAAAAEKAGAGESRAVNP